MAQEATEPLSGRKQLSNKSRSRLGSWESSVVNQFLASSAGDGVIEPSFTMSNLGLAAWNPASLLCLIYTLGIVTYTLVWD